MSVTKGAEAAGARTMSVKAGGDAARVWIPPKAAMGWSPALTSVTYFPSVKFKEALPLGYWRSPYEISSIAEARVISLAKDAEQSSAQLAHNTQWMTRIYPDGIRQVRPSSSCPLLCLYR